MADTPQQAPPISTKKTTTLGRSSTLARSVMRKRTKSYDIVQQGIKEIYPLAKPDVSPTLDIVFVPGLGASPEDSWKSSKTDFNWTTHPDGLQRDFPRARFLLYMYDSAWSGPLKVKQFMYNIAMGLLVGLRSKREGCQRRPLVLIGHSMGGLVISKAVALADSRRDAFPTMFEAITACIFFGTPFGGAPVAAVAAMYSQLADKIDAATCSKLLDLMKPGDEELRQLKNELLRLAGKSSQKIELFCFWETHPTDFSAMGGLPALFGLTKMAIPKKYAEFVNRDSATLPGIEELGLGCNHRDLVKFDGPKDDRWTQMVRDPIKRIIHGAQSAVKTRFNSVRDIDQTMINGIMDALDGAQAQKKRKLLTQRFAPSSWIPSDPDYVQWLGKAISNGAEMKDDKEPLVDFLYIRGREGRGKTSAVVAALNGVENLIRIHEEQNTGQDPILLAYFFCDAAAEYSTAEDVLKSVIKQLINQQESLAPYAKVFAKKKGKDETKFQASLTIENLWQSLQDMLADDFIGSRVYFILNNLHVLPPESDSTLKLMRYLAAELQGIHVHVSTDPDSNLKRVLTRWLITSREAHNVDAMLKADGVRMIDLEDAKYENQVQLELRNHAKKMISTLGVEKRYNKALTYFASSLIGKRAQNTQWIDITCVQLGELADTESHLRVRGVLETMPQDLTDLLNHSWLQIFRSSEEDNAEKIKEMLRALVLTYEDPTESELAILAGLASNDQEKGELRKLIEQCKPLLSLKRTSKNDCVVCFTNVVTKNHLRDNASSLLGLSKEETKWQHGILALRCFSHLRDEFDFPVPEPQLDEQVQGEDDNDEDDADEDADADEEADGDDDDENGDEEEEYSDYSGSDEEFEDEDEEEEEDKDPEADILKDKALSYTVKHWLHHASKATLEIAEDLSLEEDFWKPDSIIRHRWLVEYCRMTTTLDGFDYRTLTGLHIAAALGFRQLVAALIRNGHESEIQQRDSLVNTPLHFAAYLGRPNIVEELLNRGAVIDDAIEIHEQTPLHMASFGGHVNVMRKLLLRGADPNASANDIGPVINAAITSGNRAAVELLVEHNVSFSLPPGTEDGILPPLATAAGVADYSMFEYLIDKYADRLPAENYNRALIGAAVAGRLEVFNRLLSFEHDQETFQRALSSAVEEWNWDIVKVILDKCRGLDCNGMFFEAATCSVQQDKMVELAWQYAAGGIRISDETLNNSVYHATDREKTSTVKLLLQTFGANPNATGDEYGTALTAAAFDGNLEIVELLLDAGADSNDTNGWPLQSAATEGHYEIVEKLISHGVDVNACTDNENFKQGTALQGACESGKANIVSLLLEHQVNPNLGAGPDAPPIVAAAMRGEEDIVSMLVEAKADMDVFGGSDLSTPLINAAAYLPSSSLRLMLDAGADINLPNNEGESALMVAARRGEVEAVSFLLDNGADLLHSSQEDMNALQSAFHSQQYECLGVLIDRVSVLLGTVKKAVDSGNQAVANLVRTADMSKQSLNYDDEEPRATVRFVVDNHNVRETNQDEQSESGGDTEPDVQHDDSQVDASPSVDLGQDQEDNHDTASQHEASPEEATLDNSGDDLPEAVPENADLSQLGLGLLDQHFVFTNVSNRTGDPGQSIQTAQRPAVPRFPSWQSQQGEDLSFSTSSHPTYHDVPALRAVSPVSQNIKRKPAPTATPTADAWAPHQHSSSASMPQNSFSPFQGSLNTDANSFASGTVMPQYAAYRPMQARPYNPPASMPQTQPEYMPYMNQQQQQQQQQQRYQMTPEMSPPMSSPFYGSNQGGAGGKEQSVRHRSSSFFGMKNLLDKRW